MVLPIKNETKRRNWWALQYKNGAFYAEYDGNACLLLLYPTKKEALLALKDEFFPFEDDPVPIAVPIKIVEK